MIAPTVADLVTALEDGSNPAPLLLGPSDRAVAGITHDSRAVAPGWMFACLRGAEHDGHEHAPEALRAGAGSLLVDHDLALPGIGPTVDVAQIVVADTRKALGPVSSRICGDPSQQLQIVGITGTNGKTTTTHLLAAVFEAAGLRTGVLGTLSGLRTTPEAPDLQRRLADWVADGHDAVVMEVSSHAMTMHRVDGTRFSATVFTNLGIDHLDLHGTLEEYFAAKASLFVPELTGRAIVNRDDEAGVRLAAMVEQRGGIDLVTYGMHDIDDVEVSAASHSYRWRDVRIDVPIGGRFNALNSLAAATTAEAIGIDRSTIRAGLAGVAPIPGRFERVRAGRDGDGVSVVVDYAHTPDGLREVIAAGRDVVGPGRRVVLVFGAGGDRDQGKRPEMGAVAATADVVVVTNDNPRSEEPDAIIDAILRGVPDVERARVQVIPDRRAAIAAALDAAAPGDMVIVAGKGHETTQIIGSSAAAFDDRAVARELLENRP